MVKCPNCGEENRDGLKVCLKCGSNLVEPKEPSKPPRPPKTPKSRGGNLKKAIIVFFIILILGIIVGNFAYNSYLDNLNSANTIQFDDSQGTSDAINDIVEDNSINEATTGNENSTDNEVNYSYFSDISPLSSTQTFDFNGVFTVNLDKNFTFEEFSSPQYGATREWGNSFKEYVTYHDERRFRIIYWDNIQPSQLSHELEEDFGPSFSDGNLLIFDHKFNTGDTNTATEEDEYLACVFSGNRAVGISGMDLDKVKQYAESVKIN